MKKLISIMLILALTACGGHNEQSVETLENVGNKQLSEKGVGWGIKKNKNAEPDVPKEIIDMLPRYDAFYMDKSGSKTLYLTFDEGYENGYTAEILDTLKKCQVPAAFFVTGAYFDKEQDLIKRMVEEGHIVGNHTQNHPNLHKLGSDEKIKEELKILDDKFYEKFGMHMTYMRPPEGEYSERVLAVAKEAGYKTAFWSFAYKDWVRNSEVGGDKALELVTPYLHDGCVLLLHAVSKDNSDMLERLINFAREHGYQFKSLDDITL